MKGLIGVFAVLVLLGCASTEPQKSEVEFSYQEHFSYFGYVTHWVRNEDIPATPQENEQAQFDFMNCMLEIKSSFIDNIPPKSEIQLAFAVECMSKKNWTLIVTPYISIE